MQPVGCVRVASHRQQQATCAVGFQKQVPSTDSPICASLLLDATRHRLNMVSRLAAEVEEMPIAVSTSLCVGCVIQLSRSHDEVPWLSYGLRSTRLLLTTTSVVVGKSRHILSLSTVGPRTANVRLGPRWRSTIPPAARSFFE